MRYLTMHARLGLLSLSSNKALLANAAEAPLDMNLATCKQAKRVSGRSLLVPFEGKAIPFLLSKTGLDVWKGRSAKAAKGTFERREHIGRSLSNGQE